MGAFNQNLLATEGTESTEENEVKTMNITNHYFSKSRIAVLLFFLLFSVASVVAFAFAFAFAFLHAPTPNRG